MLKWLIDKAVVLYFRYQAQLVGPTEFQTDRRKFDYDTSGCDCGDPECGFPDDLWR